MKKNKTVIKKATSIMLSLMMTAGALFPISVPMTVNAAEGDNTGIGETTLTAQEPSQEYFATKDELVYDGIHNLDGTGIYTKVNFGRNPADGSGETVQTWYIAGYDERANNLVLLCNPNQPFLQSVSFSYAYKDKRFPVSDSMGLKIDTCTYKGGLPEYVGMSHWGLSKIRTELKEWETETNIFSAAEQKLMQNTTIYTWDRTNSDTTKVDVRYSTTDKLYLPQLYCSSNNDRSCLVVGQNSENLLNVGLKITPSSSDNHPYYNCSSFWTRTPADFGNAAIYCWNYSGDNTIDANNSYYGINTVPAFALDPSSILFISTVPAGSKTDGKHELQQNQNSYDGPLAMSFRMDDNEYNKIKSTIEYVKDDEKGAGIKVTKSTNDQNLYLCIQGADESGDWYYSKAITSNGENVIYFNDTECAINQMDSKIWIETTDKTSRLTYAKMAENVASPKASVKAGTYTENQSVTLTCATDGAVIYYTTDGEIPDRSSNLYADPIAVTGNQGESISTTIKAVAIVTNDVDEETSSVATFRYVINLPHEHQYSEAWSSNSNSHWHECMADNCTITSNNEKSGYGAHSEDAGEITKAPTATTDGIKTYKCSVCGYVIRKETIPATGTGDNTGNNNTGNNTGNNNTGNNNTGNNNTGNNTGTGEAQPAAKNTVLTATALKCKVKVTSSSKTNPTVTYVKSTNSKAKTVTIPATVKVNGVTYKVTGIASGAFSGNKKVTKVTIGKNVTSIGKNAFKNCTKLKTVTINSTVLKTIGTNAFYGDKSLKTITIKSSKLTSKSVGKNAFKGTSSKLTIKVPKKKAAAYKKFLKNKGNKKVKVK